jgi:hypothetical protein
MAPSSLEDRVPELCAQVAATKTETELRVILPQLQAAIHATFLFRATAAASNAAPFAMLCYNPRRGELMPNVSSIVKELKQERDRVAKQLSGLEAALTAFASAYSGTKPSRKRRKMSAKSRAKIAAAQRRRWAKVRAKRKS